MLRQNHGLATDPLAIAHHHYGIAIEDIALGQRVADPLTEAGVIGAGQKPV